MKIIIRKGYFNGYVIHPVDDQYEDMGCQKVAIADKEALAVFKALVSLDNTKFAHEIEILGEQIHVLSRGGRYHPPEDSLIAKIVPPTVVEGASYECISQIELDRLAELLGYIEKMRLGDSSITIEDRTVPAPPGTKQEEQQQRKQDPGTGLPYYSPN